MEFLHFSIRRRHRPDFIARLGHRELESLELPNRARETQRWEWTGEDDQGAEQEHDREPAEGLSNNSEDDRGGIVSFGTRVPNPRSNLLAFNVEPFSKSAFVPNVPLPDEGPASPWK